MVAELHLRSDDALLTATEGWQAYLQWLAHGVRSLARDHPKVFPLIATRHPAAPWLRPPAERHYVGPVNAIETRAVVHGGVSDPRTR